VGGFVRDRKSEYAFAKETVEKLAQETDERAQFVVEEQGKRIFIHTATGEHAVQADGTVGRQGPLHCSAAGKAIMAELPESRITEIIENQGLPSVTENTITDKDTFYEELKEVRERGIAFSFEESTIGLRAIASSVKMPNGSLLGSLSVSGPAHRMDGDQFKKDLPSTVQAFAQELELNIKFSK
jgi:DNA-binding IclR family transcriptional regulator